MTTSVLIWVVILCGAGTFLTRFLPMSWRQSGMKRVGGRGTLHNGLDAIGPAAIVALLVTSFSPLIAPSSFGYDVIPVAAGLLGVLAGKRLIGGIAGATLTGVAVYGAALWVMAA